MPSRSCSCRPERPERAVSATARVAPIRHYRMGACVLPSGQSERMDDANGYLEATWWTDGDGTGRLTIAASSSTGFAGRSWAWFSTGTVLEFARKLESFPLSSDDRPSLVGGSQPIGGDLLVTVGLAAYPVGSRGQVALGIELATEPWQMPIMRPEEHEVARFELL